MTNRAIAAAAYRKDVAAAIDTYHAAVADTWRKFGRPSTCIRCQAELKAVWQMLKYDLRKAGEKLDRHPVLI